MTAYQSPRLLLILLMFLLLPNVVFAQDETTPVFAAIRAHQLVISTGEGADTVVDTSAGSSVVNLNWSPDGHTLAFVLANGANEVSLWTTDDAGSPPIERVPAMLQSTFVPAFTPEGDILYVSEAAPDANSPTGYRIALNVVTPRAGAAATVLGGVPFFAEGGGGSSLPADWQSASESSAFGTGVSILEWTESGILHSLSFTGEGLALFDPQSQQDHMLVPVGDSSSQPERHINQAQLSPDESTVAAVLDTYRDSGVSTSLVLLDLATGSLTEVETVEPPRHLAWANDGTLFYSARVPAGDLLEGRSASERQAFDAATGGSGMSVGAWEVHLRHLNPATGEDALVYRVSGYEAVRLQVAPDNSLWFSLVANMDAWVDAIINGALAPGQAFEESQRALVPVRLYRLDTTAGGDAEQVAENAHQFSLRPAA